MCVCVRACMHAHVLACVRACLCVCLCVYVRACVIGVHAPACELMQCVCGGAHYCAWQRWRGGRAPASAESAFSRCFSTPPNRKQAGDARARAGEWKGVREPLQAEEMAAVHWWACVCTAATGGQHSAGGVTVYRGEGLSGGGGKVKTLRHWEFPAHS